MGKKWCTILSVWLVILSLSLVSHAVVVLREELNQRDQWVQQNLGQMTESAAPSVKTDQTPVGLVVLANLDAVQQNARADKPMKLGNVEYTRGLYCHAVSNILVQLPGPAKTFTAVVGVDNNEATAGGQGSVIFTVQVAGTDVFRSKSCAAARLVFPFRWTWLAPGSSTSASAMGGIISIAINPIGPMPK